MAKMFLFILFIFFIFCIGCTGSKNEERFRYLGEVGFRRSYNGYKDWSEAERDSAEKENPFYMYSQDSSSQIILDILTKLGIANSQELFLDKIGPVLVNSIILASHELGNDTVFIKFDTNITRSSIVVRNKKLLDSISIRDGAFPNFFRLVDLKGRSNDHIVFLNKYYISNGDNYEVSVYERK